MPEKLEGILRELKQMITIWKENGVDFDKPFSMLFKFYRSDKNPPENLMNYLKQEGYEVEGKTVRTLIIFKGYQIRATKEMQWSESLLHETTKELAIMANQNETTLEDFLASANNEK